MRAPAVSPLCAFVGQARGQDTHALAQLGRRATLPLASVNHSLPVTSSPRHCSCAAMSVQEVASSGAVPVQPLPSRLPADLHLSISRLLVEEGSTSNASAPLDDSLSLTTQLAGFFPTARDLSQPAIEKKQAELRAELREQEAHIEKLYSKLVSNLQASAAQGSTLPSSYSQHVEAKVGELLEQLSTIREKARKSEEVVRDITRDIRMLDTCKRNVVTSMTALKRLQMLGEHEAGAESVDRQQMECVLTRTHSQCSVSAGEAYEGQ